MRKIIFFIIILSAIIVLCTMVCAEQPGTAQSKPNVSGGYDFYDTTGAKTGSSSKRPDNGYDYFDQHGNKTGSILQDKDTGDYEYRDVEEIDRGSLTKEAYGGYRFKTKGEDIATAEQANIRRSYGYADTYGSGIETLPSQVVRGIDTPKNTTIPYTGLGTSGTESQITQSGLNTFSGQIQSTIDADDD
jgi:hypothetical protein